MEGKTHILKIQERTTHRYIAAIVENILTFNQNRMKQTAVEWLDEQMKTWGYLSAQMRVDIIKQAKEMNLEEIKQAYEDGKRDSYKQDDVPTAEEYVYQNYGL